jgi:hypothetical protein
MISGVSICISWNEQNMGIALCEGQHCDDSSFTLKFNKNHIEYNIEYKKYKKNSFYDPLLKEWPPVSNVKYICIEQKIIDIDNTDFKFYFSKSAVIGSHPFVGHIEKSDIYMNMKNYESLVEGLVEGCEFVLPSNYIGYHKDVSENLHEAIKQAPEQILDYIKEQLSIYYPQCFTPLFYQPILK